MGILLDVQRLGSTVSESGDKENEQCDADGGHGSVNHVSDVLEDVNTRWRWRQDGRIAQRRHLVAEVSARDDGTCRPCLTDAQSLTDTQQRDADGGNGCPWTARQQGDQCADQAGTQQEKFWRQDLHAIVNQRGNNTADHPWTREHSHRQQDQQGDEDATHGLGHLLFKRFPRHMIKCGGDQYADGHAQYQGDLASTT